MIVIQRKFPETVPILNGKLKDMMALCKNGAILKRAHSSYEGLKRTNAGRNCFPEPNIEEDNAEALI